MAGKVRGQIRWGFQPLAFLSGSSSDLSGLSLQIEQTTLKVLMTL